MGTNVRGGCCDRTSGDIFSRVIRNKKKGGPANFRSHNTTLNSHNTTLNFRDVTREKAGKENSTSREEKQEPFMFPFTCQCIDLYFSPPSFDSV